MSELQGLQSRIKEIRAAGYQVVAVSPDPVADNLRVAKRLQLDYPLLADENLELITALGLVHKGGGIRGHDVPRPATFVLHNNAIEWRDLTDNWRVRIQVEDLLQVLRSL